MSVRDGIGRLLGRLGVPLGLPLGLEAIAAVVHGGGYLRTVAGDPANAPTNTLAPAVPFLFAAAVLILLGVALAYVG
jgi:hypothetical protein